MNGHSEAVNALAASIGPGTPLYRYSDYLKRRFGGRTYRVSVDAGFTCPVREIGLPCTYCDLRGSRAPYLGSADSLQEQIKGGMAFLQRRYRAERFLLYFQAFSNTYSSVPTLRRIYDTGLACGDFAGLIVATRPDCLDEPTTALLAEYLSRGLDVWVELGLQSANDATLRRIRRGHSVAEFSRATRLLKEFNILTAAHVILGLPGEGEREAVGTARYLSELGVNGVKFHNLVITQGTALYREYRAGRVLPPTTAEHRALLISALEHLSPEVVVMRLTCDPPRGIPFVPEDQPDKGTFYRDLTGEMNRRNTWQGRFRA
ncbi:MAG: TIGR01212 family radical SAM protein [Spirochaetia bacterium]